MGKPRRNPGVSPKTPNEAGPTEILPYLYMGPHTATKPCTLIAHRLTHVISIGCRPKHHGGGGGAPAVAYHRLRLSDTPEAGLHPTVLLVVEMIRHARASEPHGRVLVHCIAGVSRSPAMLAYYLMKDEGMSLREALGLLVRARPAVRPNDGFLRQLKELEVEIRGATSLGGVEALPLDLAEKKALLGIDHES